MMRNQDRFESTDLLSVGQIKVLIVQKIKEGNLSPQLYNILLTAFLEALKMFLVVTVIQITILAN